MRARAKKGSVLEGRRELAYLPLYGNGAEGLKARVTFRGNFSLPVVYINEGTL